MSRSVLIFFALFLVVGSPAVAAGLQKEFVGSWKLISIDGPANTGTPSGIIMFDNTGHMAVQLARGSAAYTAYYGTYTFEPQNHVVIYHLENSSSPAQIGQAYIRYFEFKGNRLTLSVADDGKGGRRAFKDTTQHFVWEKIPRN